MCQSVANGGKRCDQASRFHTAKASLQHKINRQIREGHEDKATENQKRLDLLVKAQEKYGDHVFIMDMPLDKPTEILIDKLSKSGLDPIIIGGSVRDTVKGSVSKDIDIEIHGDTIDGIAATLRRNGYQVDEVGKSFGVLKVGQKNGLDVDISVPRRDSLVGNGHRGFAVTMDEPLTVKEAAERRDFTINAMGYSPVYKVAIDPFDGYSDLKLNSLKHVSDAFAEDPLRVLRGFQFASRFEMEMHPETVELSKGLLPQAKTLSEERLVTEWEKFYSKGKKPSLGLTVLKRTGWDDTVPHLKAYNTPVMAQTADKASSIVSKAKMDTEGRVRVIAASMGSHMKDNEARDFVQATVNGKDNQKKAYTLSRKGPEINDDSDARHFARSLGKNKVSIKEYIMVRSARGEDMSALEAQAKRLRIVDDPKPALVMGRDIMVATNRKPGPWMGQLTNDALIAQDNGKFFTKKDAVKWMKKELAVRDLL